MSASDMYLSIKEASAEINIPTTTITRWCREGKIFPGARKSRPTVSGKWLVPREEVEAYKEKFLVE